MTLSDVLAVVIIVMQAVLVGVMLSVQRTFSAYTEEMKRTHASNLRVLERLQEVIENDEDKPQQESA